MNLFRFFALSTLLLTSAMAEDAVFRRQLDRVASLDPIYNSSIYAARATMLCYETLLEYDYAARPYKLIPSLAEALPQVSADGLTYTLRLRENARFHPDKCFGANAATGRAVTAEDVIYSFGRVADSANASSGAWLVADIDSITALDARTIQIRLKRPMPQFNWYFAMSYLAIVPREAVEHYGKGFGDVSVGTGPYRLASWRRNYRMAFERVPAWPGWQNGEGRPFDQIVYLVMDDVTTQWLSFLDGRLDFLGEVSRDNWDAVVCSDGTLAPELKARGIRLHGIPTLEAMYIGFNMDDPVVGTNKKLRQALNCAFNMTQWLNFYNNRVIPLLGPVPTSLHGALQTPFPYSTDLARAQRLLAEAGYPNGIDPATGRRLKLTIDLGRANQDMRESTELLAAFYARVGIDLQPRYNSWPTFLKKVSSRQTQLFRIGWAGDYPDPQNFLQLFISENLPPGPNRSCYLNPEIDRLYQQLLTPADPAAQTAACTRMQEIIREDCPWIFTHVNKAYTLTGPRVLNYIPHDFPYGTEKHLRLAPAD